MSLDSANYQPRLIAATGLQLNLRGEAWSFPEVIPNYRTKTIVPELVSVSASSKETPPLELKLQRWRRWLPSRYLNPKLTSGKAELLIVIVFRASLMKVQEALQLVLLHNLRKHVPEEVRPEGKSIWLVYVQWLLLVTLPYLPQKRGKGSGNNSSLLRYCYVLPKLCNNFVSCGTGEGMNVSSCPHPPPTPQ